MRSEDPRLVRRGGHALRAATTLVAAALLSLLLLASAAQAEGLTPPVVSSISPSEGPVSGGTVVTITGSNFTAAATVAFGGVAAGAVSCPTSVECTATAPAGSAAVHVTVTTAEGTSEATAADLFTYVPAPVVSKVEPAEGPAAGGTTVTITGENLSGASAVRFGAAPASSFTCPSSISCTATSPAGSSTVDVTVTTAGGTSATSPADAFTYIPAPAVTGLSPAAGREAGGTSVTISGTSLAGATAVRFGAAAASSFQVNQGGTVTAVSPAGSGTVHVTVTTPGGTSASSEADLFTYAPRPSVTELTPQKGPEGGGTSLAISGSGLTGASAVNFGSTPAASFHVNSDSSITAVSPREKGIQAVTVTTPGGTSLIRESDWFTFVPAPTVTGLKPATGPASGGTTVTVKGTGFSEVSSVTFGSTPAQSFTVTSSASLTALAPAHAAGVVQVTVTAGGGESAPSSKASYRFAPVVSGLSPNTGPAAGGTVVTMTGSGFSTAAGQTIVKFGTVKAKSVTCSSSSECTVVSPAGAPGQVEVKVTVAKVTSAKSPAALFTYS